MTQNTRSQSGNSSLKQAQQKRHARIIRVSAYSVAMVLALLLVNSALPPLLADQSDRAVIDAPITLLTSPIAGEVTSIVGAAGQRASTEYAGGARRKCARRPIDFDHA